MKRAIALSLALFAHGAAMAADSPAVRARAECTADVLRLCAAHVGTSPDIPKIVSCLKANESSLSAGCRAALTAIKR